MRQVSQEVLDMLKSGYQLSPKARLVVDIDPPFVGTDFNQVGADPSLYLYKNVLYLTFIDGEYIKVAIVDRASNKVIDLLRQIDAPGASSPKLTFEPSTYTSMPDLPHVVYIDTSTGKVMAYREQYNEKLEIVKRYDEIGTGSSIDVVRVNHDIYHFYTGSDGKLYERKQGEFATVLIKPERGAITSVRALSLPDGRICLIYLVSYGQNGGEIRTAYSNLLLPIRLNGDGVISVSELTSFEFKQTAYQYNEGIETTASAILELIATTFLFAESVVPHSQLTEFALPKPHYFDGNVEPLASLMQFAFPVPHFYDEGVESTASLQALELVS
mgnify:CR=1 FL=1